MTTPAFKISRLLLPLLFIWLGGCAAYQENAYKETMKKVQAREEKYHADTLAKLEAIHSKSADEAGSAELIARNWGPLGDFVGNYYLETSYPMAHDFVSYHWIKPGLMLEKIRYADDKFEAFQKTLFWYDSAAKIVRTNRNPLFLEKGEYDVVFGSDGVLRFIDRKNDEIGSNIRPLKDGYEIEKNGFFYNSLRTAKISSAEEIQKKIAARLAYWEAEKNSSSSSTFWSDMAGALSAGVAQGVAQANTEQQNRQMQQNQQRSALMAAQAETSAREQRLLSERQVAARNQQGGMAQQQTTSVQPTRQSSTAQRTTATTRQSAATVAAASTTATRQKTEAKPALGPARAWCMQKRNGEFSCNGPLQNGGWGATLKGALKMVDCTDGAGFTPTIGGGGELFHCGRDLRPGEKVVPASDPFRQ